MATQQYLRTLAKRGLDLPANRCQRLYVVYIRHSAKTSVNTHLARTTTTSSDTLVLTLICGQVNMGSQIEYVWILNFLHVRSK